MCYSLGQGSVVGVSLLLKLVAKMVVSLLLFFMLRFASGFDIEYAHEQLSHNSIVVEFEADDNQSNIPVAIDTKTVIHTTSENFLSLALDAGLMRRKWETFDIR